jgi:hypothetical protein
MTQRRTPAGALIRHGRIVHRFEYDPSLGDALPAWLSQAVGTGTVTGWNNGSTPANYRITAASAAINGAGRLKVATGIRADKVEEIEFRLQGFRFDTAVGWAARIEIGHDSQDRGISLRHDNHTLSSVDTAAYIRAHNGAAVVDHPTHWQLQQLNGGSARPRDITLILRPQTREVILLEDDQCMAYVQMNDTESLIAGTLLQPQITFANADAVQHWCSFAKLSVTVRTNA